LLALFRHAGAVWRCPLIGVERKSRFGAVRTVGSANVAADQQWSLIVLPFANLNNDPEQDFFADAITTDLTTDLAQTPYAFVIGRETAFTYKNRAIDLRTIGKDLGKLSAKPAPTSQCCFGATDRVGERPRSNGQTTAWPSRA
jgi:hypothetical protein